MTLALLALLLCLGAIPTSIIATLIMDGRHQDTNPDQPPIHIAPARPPENRDWEAFCAYLASRYAR